MPVYMIYICHSVSDRALLEKYWSSIGTNGFIASDPTSVNNNTLQVGAPRTISGAFSMRF